MGKMRRVWGVRLGNGRPTLVVREFIAFRSVRDRGRRVRSWNRVYSGVDSDFLPPPYTLPVRRSVHVMLAFPGSVTSRDLAPASTTGPLGYQGRTCIHRQYQTPIRLEGTRRRAHGPKAGHRYVLIRTIPECKAHFLANGNELSEDLLRLGAITPRLIVGTTWRTVVSGRIGDGLLAGCRMQTTVAMVAHDR